MNSPGCWSVSRRAVLDPAAALWVCPRLSHMPAWGHNYSSFKTGLTITETLCKVPGGPAVKQNKTKQNRTKQNNNNNQRGRKKKKRKKIENPQH